MLEKGRKFRRTGARVARMSARFDLSSHLFVEHIL